MKGRNRWIAAAALTLFVLATLASSALAGAEPGSAAGTSAQVTVARGESFRFSGTGLGLALTTAPNTAASGAYVLTGAEGSPVLTDAEITVEANSAAAGRQRLTLSATMPADAAPGAYTYAIGFRLTGSFLIFPVTSITLIVEGAEPSPSAPGPSDAPSPSPQPSSGQPGPSASPAVSVDPLPSVSAAPSASAGSADRPVPRPDGPLRGLVFSAQENGGFVLTGIPISSAAAMCTHSDLTASLECPAGCSLEVAAAEGEPLPESAPLATGCRLIMRDPAGAEAFMAEIVVHGDVLGNGRISIAQVVRMAQALNGTRPLEGIYLLAGDFNGQSGVDISDVVREARLLTAGS